MVLRCGLYLKEPGRCPALTATQVLRGGIVGTARCGPLAGLALPRLDRSAVKAPRRMWRPRSRVVLAASTTDAPSRSAAALVSSDSTYAAFRFFVSRLLLAGGFGRFRSIGVATID